MSKGNMGDFAAVVLLCLLMAIPVAWVWNMSKLFHCDFEADYRCEVLHGMGVAPPLAIFTVWAGTDE